MKTSLLPASLAALALSGCVSLAPGYERPDAPIPQTLPAGDGAEGLSVRGADFRAVIEDETLEGLIETAIENNRDLRVALLNVRAARAQYGIQRAARFPSLTATGSISEQEVFDDGGSGTPSDDPGVIDPSSFQFQAFDQASARLAIPAYELDLFGRVTSLNRAALQRYFAAEENARAATLSLVGAVADAWLTLVQTSQLLALAEETAESQEQSLSLTQALFDAGQTDDLDLQRAIASVEQAVADTAQFRAQRQQALNALALLTAEPISEETRQAAEAAGDSIRLDLVAGRSSDILLNRPDVRAAERQLMAANADIGVARAAFFPQITLAGNAGYASEDLDGLFSDGIGIWAFTPQVSLPIFSGGRNISNLRLSKAQRDVAVAQYEGAVQAAFRDTADALAIAETIDERIAALERLVAAGERALFLSEERLRGGVDTYLSVLDAQRTLYQSNQALIAAKTERSRNAVALYQALGGPPASP